MSKAKKWFKRFFKSTKKELKQRAREEEREIYLGKRARRRMEEIADVYETYHASPPQLKVEVGQIIDRWVEDIIEVSEKDTFV